MADRNTWLHSCQHCGWVQQGPRMHAGRSPPSAATGQEHAWLLPSVLLLGAGAERAGHLLEDVLLLVASNLVTIFSLGSPERGGKQ